MRYKITGMGGIASLDDEELPPARPITLITEGKSEEKILEQFELYGGVWSECKFFWFEDSPNITPLPEDQNLRFIGAPMLPGLSAY